MLTRKSPVIILWRQPKNTQSTPFKVFGKFFTIKQSSDRKVLTFNPKICRRVNTRERRHSAIGRANQYVWVLRRIT